MTSGTKEAVLQGVLYSVILQCEQSFATGHS